MLRVRPSVPGVETTAMTTARAAMRLQASSHQVEAAPMGARAPVTTFHEGAAAMSMALFADRTFIASAPGRAHDRPLAPSRRPTLQVKPTLHVLLDFNPRTSGPAADGAPFRSCFCSAGRHDAMWCELSRSTRGADADHRYAAGYDALNIPELVVPLIWTILQTGEPGQRRGVKIELKELL